MTALPPPSAPAENEIAEAARNYVEARREFKAATSRVGARQVLDLAWTRLERAYDAESELFGGDLVTAEQQQT